MEHFDPMPHGGGPDFVMSLRVALSAWELKSVYTPMAPAAGGEQISIRLPKDKIALLDVVASRSGWSRNQVLLALLDPGLRSLFEGQGQGQGGLPERTRGQIGREVFEKLFPGQTLSVQVPSSG